MKRVFCFFSILLCLGAVSAQSPEMMEAITARTVLVVAMDEASQPLTHGSGFVVSPMGEIATNYHVIEGATSATVKFPSMEMKFPVAEIVHLDPVHDLAVIRVNFKANPLYIGSPGESWVKFA